MGSRLWLRTLAILASLPLIQCGDGGGIASEIDMEMFPSRPVVILSDYTLNPGLDNEKLISGPWFKTTYRITNNSEKTITIQSLRFKITSISTTGTIGSAEVGIDPTDYELFFCPAHDPTYLETVGPGQTIYAGGTASPALNPCLNLYIGGLATNVQTYSYQVEVKIEGWVGTPGLPEDRLSKSIYFATQ